MSEPMSGTRMTRRSQSAFCIVPGGSRRRHSMIIQTQNKMPMISNPRTLSIHTAMPETTQRATRGGALYFMSYNFCRIHQSLRVTPAMEAGVRITFGAWRKQLRC
jgi:hypothetical protein